MSSGAVAHGRTLWHVGMLDGLASCVVERSQRSRFRFGPMRILVKCRAVITGVAFGPSECSWNGLGVLFGCWSFWSLLGLLSDPPVEVVDVVWGPLFFRLRL